MKNLPVLSASFRRLLVGAVLLSAVAMTSCKSNDPAYTAAMRSLYKRGVPKEKVGNVAVVDFTRSSTKKRLSIYNADGRKKSSHLVAHGYGSGKKYAEEFSNRSGSGQSSLGLYQIGSPYYGKHGKSLKLHGLDPGINSAAYRRAIVMHSADYVSKEAKWENYKAGEGWRIGRSAGCPAVSKEDMKRMLAELPTGSFLYIYAGQKEFLPRIEEVEPPQDPALHMLASNKRADSKKASGVRVQANGTDGRMRIELPAR